MVSADNGPRAVDAVGDLISTTGRSGLRRRFTCIGESGDATAGSSVADNRIGCTSQAQRRGPSSKRQSPTASTREGRCRPTPCSTTPRAKPTTSRCACYHDQALIPIKTLAFDHGVNVTLGLRRADLTRPWHRLRYRGHRKGRSVESRRGAQIGRAGRGGGWHKPRVPDAVPCH